MINNYKLLTLLSVCILVTSCTAAGVALTGAKTVYDRHNIQKSLDDKYTTFLAYRTIYSDTDKYQGTSVTVSTYQNTVLITGQVPDKTQQQEITNIVKDISGDRKVYNFTEELAPSSALTRASDSWISSKIKAKLIAVNDVDPSKIKVITENGTVFLMGVVEREQALIAADIAQGTNGVQGVVKVFSYLEIVRA